MTPPNKDDPRPSVPHSIHRGPTGPNSEISGAASIPAGALDGWTVEDFIKFMDNVVDKAVLRTQEKDKLRVDTAIGLVSSQVSAALTKGEGEARRYVVKWKAIAAFLASVAGGMGLIMATCMNAYQDARFDVVVPAAQAKEKVITLEERMEASEKRHDATDNALADLSKSLKANTDAVLGIAAKLEQPTRIDVPTEKKKNR